MSEPMKCKNCGYKAKAAYRNMIFCNIESTLKYKIGSCTCEPERVNRLLSQLPAEYREAVEVGQGFLRLVELMRFPSGNWRVGKYDEELDEWNISEDQLMNDIPTPLEALRKLEAQDG